MNRELALDILSSRKAEWTAKYGLTKLGIFGSVARGQAQPSSDVDVIIGTSNPDAYLLVALREELIEALGADVDLVTDHEYLRPFFKARLAAEAVYV